MLCKGDVGHAYERLSLVSAHHQADRRPHQRRLSSMESSPDVATVVAAMVSENESHRKLAVFHLQSLLSDAEFADTFVQGAGLPVLRRVVLEDNANTLAYALGSFNKLLEQDYGWDELGSEVIGRVSRKPNLLARETLSSSTRDHQS